MKPIHRIVIILLALASFAGEFFFLSPEDGGHWWNKIPGFYALCGFGGCVLIVYISKWLGKLFIQNKEDYYDAR